MFASSNLFYAIREREKDEREGMGSAHHNTAMCHIARGGDVFGALQSPRHLAAACPLSV